MVAFSLVLLMMAVDPAGLSAWRQRRFDAAEAAFRNALRRRPSDAMTRVWLARTLVELHRNPEAAAEIQKVLTGAVAPDVRLEAGRLLREMAERHLAQLQTVAPDSPAATELAGERYEWTGDLDAALAEYRAAAKSHDDRPGTHYRIGNILWLKRQTDEALIELQKELALNPQHGMANLRVGQLLLLNRAEESLPYFERALRAMPESIEARREAGKAYRKAGRNSEARALWESVAKARPGDDQVHYLLANLYRDLGENALFRVEIEKHRALLEHRRETAGQGR